MNIVLAKNAGFCPGVRRAADTLEKALAEARGTDTKVYTLGRIIHNDEYIQYIRSMGCGEITRDDVDDVIALLAGRTG